MTSRKRDRLEVIYHILRIVRDHHNSIKPTPLLRASNLSSASFSDYYVELAAKGFVKEIVDHDGHKYVTLTDHGFMYLEKYQSIIGFVEEFDL